MKTLPSMAMIATARPELVERVIGFLATTLTIGPGLSVPCGVACQGARQIGCARRYSPNTITCDSLRVRTFTL